MWILTFSILVGTATATTAPSPGLNLTWHYVKSPGHPDTGTLTLQCKLATPKQLINFSYVQKVAIVGTMGQASTPQSIAQVTTFGQIHSVVPGARAVSDLNFETPYLTVYWNETQQMVAGTYSCTFEYMDKANAQHHLNAYASISFDHQSVAPHDHVNILTLQEMTTRILDLQRKSEEADRDMTQLKATNAGLVNQVLTLTTDMEALKHETNDLRKNMTALTFNLTREVHTDNGTLVQGLLDLANRVDSLDILTENLARNVSQLCSSNSDLSSTASPLTATSPNPTGIALSELVLLQIQMKSLRDAGTSRDSQLNSLKLDAVSSESRTNATIGALDTELRTRLTTFSSSLSYLNTTVEKLVQTNQASCTCGLPAVIHSPCESMAAGQTNNVTASTNGHLFRCDTVTDGGRWTIFQLRSSGSIGFYQNWDTYRSGFGSMFGDYWLGLETLYQLVANGHWEMRVDMIRADGTRYYAQYNHFNVSSEQDGYRLHVSGYFGNAGDSLSHSESGMKFSTFDQDNDKCPDSCAVTYRSGWWFNDCFESNLNGQWGGRGDKGLLWYALTGFKESLTFTEMKVRRVP